MKQGETEMQLTLNFEGGLVSSYSSCREFIAARVHQQGRPQKAVAADMDLSPSQLSRKCAQNPDDSMRFTLDDLERFVESTGDTQPILYLAEKFLTKPDEAALVAQIEALQAQLKGRRK